jgi:diacylglycerol kinase family enzyme
VTPVAQAAGPPYVLVARNASRLADPARRAALVAHVVAAVEARTGAKPEIRETISAAGGREVAREAVTAGSRLVVVVGGDGSVCAAAGVLAGTPVPLGVVPAGTANHLAAVLDIPRRFEQAAALLATGQVRAIDIGLVRLGDDPAATRLPFVVVAGIGFDARAIAATTERRKRSLGVVAYYAVAAAVGLRVRPFAVRLDVDGVIHETDALVVLVANSGHLVPGILGPRRPFVPDDGLLDVLVARGRGPVGLARAGLELLCGRQIDTEFGAYGTRFMARRVEVVAPAGVPVEVDGDVLGAGGFVAEVAPGALRVLVPGGGQPAAGPGGQAGR